MATILLSQVTLAQPRFLTAFFEYFEDLICDPIFGNQSRLPPQVDYSLVRPSLRPPIGRSEHSLSLRCASEWSLPSSHSNLDLSYVCANWEFSFALLQQPKKESLGAQRLESESGCDTSQPVLGHGQEGALFGLPSLEDECSDDLSHAAAEHDIKCLLSASSLQSNPIEEHVLSLPSLLLWRRLTTAVPQAGTGETGPVNLVIVVEDAIIHRTFAKVGRMHTYAVVSVDETRVMKTKRDNGTSGDHLKPTWAQWSKVKVVLPEVLRIELFDGNKLHRDVSCGCAEVTLTSTSHALGEHTVTLRKHASEITASLRLTIKEAS